MEADPATMLLGVLLGICTRDTISTEVYYQHLYT